MLTNLRSNREGGSSARQSDASEFGHDWLSVRADFRGAVEVFAG